MIARIVSLSLLVPFASSAALACSCAYGPTQILPDGGTAVPTSASVFIEYNYVDSADGINLQLVRSDTGVVVPTTAIDAIQGDTVIRELRPDALLDPLTDYGVREIWDEGEAASDHASFTTGEAPDVDAPAPVAITDTRTESESGVVSSCGASTRLMIELPQAEEPARYEVEVATDSTGSDAQIYTFLDNRWIGLGHGGCSTNKPDLEKGDTYFLRSRVVDLSGNASPWRDYEEQAHVGCSSVGGAGLGSAWLAVFALLGRRRSRATAAS